MTKVLMVCLGNICRSPLAEGILKYKLKNTEIEVASAGTAAYHIGKSPDHRSINVAASKGIDISGQQATQFKVNDFDTYSHIFAMDQNNYKDLLSKARTSKDKSKVALLIQNEEVPDPYYGEQSDFENVFHLIDKACNELLKKFNHGELLK